MSFSAVVVAREAGAAVALAPVARALLDAGGRCRVHAVDRAVVPFERRGLSVWAWPEQAGASGLGRLLADASPSVLLTGTSVHPDRDSTWWAAARHRGVPSLAVVDHWTPLVERFSHRRPFDCTPDAVGVLDDASAAALRRAGAPFPVHVVGHPGLEEIARAGASARERTKKALDVAPDRPLVVFASEPQRDHFGSALDHRPHGRYDEGSVLDAVRGAVQRWREDALLVVKLHPLEGDDAHAAAADGVPETRILRAGDNVALLTAADAVVGMSSMLLVESAILGVPTISLRPGGLDAPFPAWADAIAALADPAGLEVALREATARPQRIVLPMAGAALRILDLARTLAPMPAAEAR